MKPMKSLLSLLGSAALIASLLSGCAQQPSPGTSSAPPVSSEPPASSAVTSSTPAPEVQTLPALETVSYELDLKNQAKQYYYGLYEQQVELADKSMRTMKVYCPEGSRRDCSALFVAVPDQVDTAAFLAQSGWIDLADAKQHLLVAFEPEGQKWGESQQEADYIDAAFKAFNGNTYFYSYGQDCRFVGYGKGGDALHEFVLRNPISVAAFAAIDASESISASTLTQVGSQPFNDTHAIPLGEIPVPVWIVSSSVTPDTQRVADYWREANDCTDEVIRLEDGTLVYEQDPYSASPFTYNQKVAKVMVTEKAVEYHDSRLTQTLYDQFLSHYARTGGGSPYSNVLKAAVDESLFRYDSQEIGGVVREWYTYLPSDYDPQGDPMPVVIYLHGGGQSGLMGMKWADWWRTGEEKGFIVVCPSAALSNLNGDGKPSSKVPSMGWNAAEDPDRPDDGAFIKTLTEWIKSQYNTDPSRFYITGQSAGSQMATYCAIAYPDIFAAHASTGSVGLRVDREFQKNANEALDIPTMIILGQYDNYEYDLTKESHVTKQFTYFTSRYGLELHDPSTYVNGTYSNQVWIDDDGVPMVRMIVVEGRAHSWRPEETYLMWNEWFSLFSRGEDGSVVFMGK